MPFDQFNDDAQKALNQALGGAASNHHSLQQRAAAHMSDVANGHLAGSIIWEKVLGRPSTQKLCDGFTINLVTSTFVRLGPPEGPVGGQLLGKWIDGTIAVESKWDDSDGKHYLVHFLHTMTTGGRLRVNVDFSDPEGWQNASGARSTEHLILSPSHREYGVDLPQPTIPNWIEPFRVILTRQSPAAFRIP